MLTHCPARVRTARHCLVNPHGWRYVFISTGPEPWNTVVVRKSYCGRREPDARLPVWEARELYARLRASGFADPQDF